MDESQVLPLGWKGYFERFVAPLLARDRFFMAMVLALAVAVVEAIALLAMVPLHRLEPYVVEVNAEGRVIAGGVVRPTMGAPTSAEMTYWLGKWVSGLYVVDPVLSRRNLRDAYMFTHGPAVGHITRFIKSSHSPLARMGANPALRTKVTVDSVRSIGEDEAYVVVSVKNLLTGKTRTHGVTVGYGVVPPKTVAEALANPIGLRITNFSLDSETP